ncbi:MAG: sensor histidine kinase [Acidimicrobiales bacterium]
MQIAASWRTDAVFAAGLGVGLLTYQAAAATFDPADWTLPVRVVLGCGAIAGRRLWPVAAAAVFAGGSLMVRGFGHAHLLDGPTNLLLIAVFMVAYTLGTRSGWAAGLGSVVVISAGLQAGSPSFNPFLLAIAFGPWLAGRVVNSRRRLVVQIEARNHELEEERIRFAQESVRYERARIARELHDIVAHCVSLMVIQAAVGQQLIATSNRGAVADSLDCIADATHEAQTEIAKLVALLSGTHTPEPAEGLRTLGDLVERAHATGLAVHYRLSGDCHHLDSTTSDIAYRVVQESLTNSIKHAPGAPVDIFVRETATQIEVEVVSGPACRGLSGLEHSGGGRGLLGMRERVNASDGTVTAGPTTLGGWRVSAVLPRQRHEAAGYSKPKPP